MKKAAFIVIFLAFGAFLKAQTGTEFWLAPPDVTRLHNTPGDEPIYFNATAGASAAVVTISQPANPAFNGGSPIVINVPANSSVRYNLTALKAQLETRPTDSVRNTGLKITSTTDITCYYESSNSNNPDIIALKGANGLGTEFYIPLHKHAPFYNHDFGNNADKAFASFDIVATEDNTVVLIYSPVAVDGHPALTPFTVNLNQGQSYSCANTKYVAPGGNIAGNYVDPTTHPSGAAVLSNKPIAITIKDDSNHNPSGGCYDLMMDQIVPVNILGTDYIAVKGSLDATGDESTFLMAVENNTQVFLNGSNTPVATLFAGQYYRHDMDYLSGAADNSTYMRTSKPVYAVHVTGFGCEMGMAILPPLNCAGSQRVGFTRSTNEGFFLNLLVRTGAEGSFTVAGPGTATIPASAFKTVPGTNGEWKAAHISYTTAQVPVNQGIVVTNTADVFSLGIINGGAGSGVRYGFFSEFSGKIEVNAGADQTLCAGQSATLAGTVSGGSTTGMWSTNGSGTFLPNANALNATYEPSIGDIALGTVTLTLVSTGQCTPEQDQMVLTIQPKPVPNAGADQFVCTNNPVVALAGTVHDAVGGVWTTGGTGTFNPSNANLNANYVPGAADLAAGSVWIFLTTTGNGVCNAVRDSMLVTFTPAITVNAGADRVLCSNNAAVQMNGSFSVATGAVWSGGAGTFDPSTTNVNAVYTPTQAEINSGSVVLTLTSTGNGNCLAVSDQVQLSFTPAPTANAGANSSVCANNASIALNGSVTVAAGGAWSGGTGSFSPNNSALNATYTPTAAEIANGSVTLVLTTTGNGNCLPATSSRTITFTPAPTVNAGADGTVCANNAAIALNGAVSGATGGTWSGGTGTFSPNAHALNAVYTPSAAERTAGTVTLILTSTGNGNCSPVADQVTYTITPAPTANAGDDQTICANNAVATLNGSFTLATGAAWSGGNGSFDPSTTNMGAKYTPTPAEIANGSVTLTLTTTGNGNCVAATDQVVLHFTPAPVVNAGPNTSVCANNAGIALNGTVTGATGGIWSGGTGSFSPNNTALTGTYTPTAAEIAAGSITLTLTSTGHGNCTQVSSSRTINFTAAPIVDAGPHATVCANAPAMQLNGSVIGATGGIWSGGNGSFSPNNTTLNAVYMPTPAERSAGSVTLTLTSAGNGNCTAVTDQVTWTITPAPTVNAGLDRTVCGNNAAVVLNGSFTVATGGVWSGGNGSFDPSTTNMNATYTPTPAEVATGSVTLTLTTTGNALCNSVSDQVQISFTASPTANAGPDVTRCANNASVALNGSVTLATGGAWSGGTGVFTPNNNSLTASYAPTAAEIANGSVTLMLTTTGNGTCNSATDTKLITFSPAPVVSAGTNGTVCANNPAIALSGSVTGATGGSWSGGTGSFSPNANALNAVYTPSAAERAAGTVTLTLTSTGNGLCNAVSSPVTFTITPAPTVNAGPDQNLCSNNPVAALAGSYTVATGAVWSGGAGTFSPSPNNVNATYTPTPGEVANGTVTLTLTTTGNNNCNPVSDNVVLHFTPSPMANAGVDVTRCANNANVVLNGNVTVATGGVWSGGLGSFTPNNTALNATYVPTPAEIAAGTVTLTLTTTGNGNCAVVTDTKVINFTPAPTVEAGPNGTVCANNAAISLGGQVTVAGGGIWSGGSGSFAPNASTLNAVYTPSAAERAAGTVTLTLTTVGNGNCSAVSDQVTYTITPALTANAGADKVLCSNNPATALAGAFTVATGAVWSGGNGTFDPSTANMSAVYTPTAAEVANGSVTLTLTTSGNGNCNAATDQVLLTFTDGPTANAGPDVTTCANNATIPLGGSVMVATGGTWSGGTGTFSPNANTLNATYSPSAADLAAGQVTLVLTTTGNGNCAPAIDAKTIFYTPAPIVNAGGNGTVCANAPSIALNGTITGAAGGVWSGGAGSFSPNNITLNATYMPTAAEITSGGVTLTLTSAGNGLCNPVSQQVHYTITPAPTVNAGADQTRCANNGVATLNAAITVATGVQWSGGTGLYSPGSTAQNITYTPSSIDIANGSVILTATTTGNGNCAAVADQVVITYTPAPTANAGPDQSVSENNPATTLAGSYTLATGATWSGGAGTYTPNNHTANAVYTPTAAEIAAGSITLTLTTTGNGSCAAASDQMTITFTDAPTANAGPDQTICANNATVSLNGSVTIAAGGIWSGGNGTFMPNNTSLATTYLPSAAEIASGSVTLTLTTVGNGNSNPVSDQVVITITPAPLVNAGLDRTACANQAAVQLAGVVTHAAGGVWSGGAGTFTPNSANLNAVYTPSNGEVATGTVTLTLTSTGNGLCNAVSDQMVISIAPAPVVNAGADRTVCSNNAAVQLAGSVVHATGGIWSGGTGGFSPSINALNAVYTPSITELANGSVTLSLTSTGNGSCLPVSDQMTIYFSQAPTANAGVDRTVCANDPSVALNGAVTIATGGVWSGGSGTFSPNANTLNATYHPSPAEVALGTANLTLTTTGNGLCNAVADHMVITILASPVAEAGNDISVCSNNPQVQLGGSVVGAGGGQWSGGAGTFSPSIASLNAIYMPTPAEVAAGSLTLTLTTIGNGNCVPVSDQVLVTFTAAPTAHAGADATYCANNAAVQLAGSVTVANGGAWSGGGGTFTPNANALNAVYTPSLGEIAAGVATLTLTTTGNNGCIAVSDQVAFAFTPAPTANAGADASICANNATYQLNGTVSVATGGVWSGGQGTYSPSNTALNAVYTPTAAEINAGSVTLTLTTTGNGLCNAVSDQMVLSINPAPVVEAGSALTSCANNASAQLAGSVQYATGGAWTGNGSFTPSASNLNAVYHPTAAEIAAGTAIITLTSTGNGLCTAVSDQVVLTITGAPVVNAGADQILCANNAAVQLNGNVVHATGGAWSGGLGSFTPATTSLNAVYVPTAGELAAGHVKLVLTSTGNGGCVATTDTMQVSFTPAPTANAGSDVAVCANAAAVQLNGAVTVATGGLWSGGQGTFSPGANVLNASYTPSATEISSGSVTLTLTTTGMGNCAPVSDNVTISISPVPVVNAGPDLSVCRNNSTFQLNGFVGNAPGSIWSGGAGLFNPGNTYTSTSYAPTAAELAAGSLTLTLTSTGTTICAAKSDEVTIHFTDSPVVDAGADFSVCANAPLAQLQGNVTNASGGAWSGGAGTFTPSNAVFSPAYTPTAAEIAAGSVTLTFTSTGNGNCSTESDQVLITITPAPTISAGADITVCANAPQVQLNGSVTVAAGVKWSGGAGVFSPDKYTPNAVYTPTASEIAAGTFQLALTSTGNGLCTAVSDTMSVTVTPAPMVNAGADQTNCASNLSVVLNGSVGGTANTGLWSSSGTGYFIPSPTALDATYMATIADSLAGSVTLTLTHTGNNLCAPVSDAMEFTILPSAVANAGPDQSICATTNTVQLQGSIVGNATEGMWTTTGSGQFTPNAAAANAQYQPTAADRAAGSLTFTWSVNSCDNAMDQMVLTIIPASVVNAGPDHVACTNALHVPINGAVSGASNTGIWTTLGSGTFSQAPTLLSNMYNASAADSLAGGVRLVLTSTATGLCAATSDTLHIQILPDATVNAGVDQSFCANNVSAQLNGTLTGNINSTVWTTSGTGTFVPSATVLDPVYVPSAVDTALGGVTLTLSALGSCNNASDAMLLTLTPAPYVNAGTDQTFCNLVNQFTLNGAIGGPTSTGFWTTTGTGTLVNPAAPVTSYMASAADLATGRVDFVLTSLNNGACNAVSDTMSIYIGNGVVVNAGPDQTICASSSHAQLWGAIQNGAPLGTWTTTGNGTFSPSPSALNARYLFTPQDVANGSVMLTLTSQATATCPSVQDQLLLTFGNTSFADAGADEVVCANNPTVVLNGHISGGAIGSVWSTTGTGYFSNNSSLNSAYTMSPADILAGSVQLRLTTVTNGNCAAVTDVMTVTATPLPQLNVGADRVVCNANPIQLNANMLHAQGVVWSTTGTGSFMDPNALVTLYYPSVSDSLSGSVELTATTTGNEPCSSVSDALTVTFGGGLTAFAGADVVACSTSPNIPLNAQVSGTTTGVWTTSGTGTFSPSATSLQATYIPGSADFAIGQINLVITTTNNLGCAPGRDTVRVTYHLPPTVNAGADVRLCDGIAPVQLNGGADHAASIAWSSAGTGTFAPSADVLAPTYLPSQADSLAGGVELTLIAEGTGGCAAISDALYVAITPTRQPHAGADANLCADGGALQLNGTITGAGGGVWSTNGTGTFLPDAHALDATYTPSNTDLVFPALQFILSTTDNQGCAANTDTMTVQIHQLPMAMAGADVRLCDGIAPVQLAGAAQNAAAIQWTTNGSGIFSPAADVAAPIYLPSLADSAMGQVELVMTVFGTGGCAPATDAMTVFITPTRLPNAGMDMALCASGAGLQLAGSLIGPGGAVWSTTGTGTFLPDANTLDATYVPSTTDLVFPHLVFTLSTTDNEGCTPNTDAMIVVLHQLPTANAGADVLLCNGIEGVQLLGTMQNGATAQWSTSGSGTFNPSVDVADPVYQPSQADSIAGVVQLTFTVQGTGGCAPATDVKLVTIVPTRQPNAGYNLNACADGQEIQLQGSITGPGGAVWSTTGTGTFLPDANTLNAVYQPSSTDLVFNQLQFTLTTTDNQGCMPNMDAMTLFMHQPPVAHAGADQSVCNAALGLSLNGSVAGATGGVWSTTGTGTFLPNAQSLTAQYQPSTQDALAGLINLVLTTTGSAFCPATSDTLVVNFSNPMVPDFDVSQFCAGTATQFDDNTNANGAQVLAWNWSFSDGAQLSGQHVSHAFGPGDHSALLTVIGPNGCTSSISKDFTILEVPLAGFGTGGSMTVGEPVTFTDASEGAVAWLYTFGDSTAASALPSPSHTYGQAGRYVVTQVVTNANGCSATLNMIVEVQENEIQPPMLPNAFSPNGDGVNDVFYVRGGPFAEMHLVIYNGWGEKIFESQDPLFGWDGTYKGKPEVNGVYTYTVSGITTDGQEHARTGKVSLIR